MAMTPLMLEFDAPWAAFATLTLSAAALWSFHGPLMTWPASFLERDKAAIGFSLMNAVGSFGGFLGPFLLGYLANITNNYDLAMLVISGILGLGAIAIFLFPVSSAASAMLSNLENVAPDMSTTCGISPLQEHPSMSSVEKSEATRDTEPSRIFTLHEDRADETQKLLHSP